MQLRETIVIQAPPPVVARLYADPHSWAVFYPAIQAVSVVGQRGGTTLVDVAHEEGTVRNEVTVIDASHVRLFEDKRRYVVRFDVQFRSESGGTRVHLVGDVRVKGILRVFSPLARSYARRLIRTKQLQPLKHAAERAKQSPC